MASDAGEIGLQVRQSEFSYIASLVAPAFDVLAVPGQLFGAIYSGLAPFGVKLTEIKVETPSLNPGDISVACFMLDRGSVIRYRLDRVEVWSTNPRAFGEEGLAQLIEGALRVLQQASGVARVATHTLSLAFHGLFTQGKVADRLALYVSRGPANGLRFRPSGVSFSCELPEGQGEGSIVLERSLIVPEGAFLRGTSVHPGKLSEREAFQSAAKFFVEATGALSIKLQWES